MNDLPHNHRDKPSFAGLPVRVERLALAAVPAWLTLSFLVSADAPVELKAIVGIVAIVSAIRPTEGLCIVAATVPLGDLIAIAMESSPVRLSEALVVAFLAGWLVSPSDGPARGPSPGAAVRYAAMALSAAILASIAVNALQIRTYYPAMWPDTLLRSLHNYFGPGSDEWGAVAGGRLIEGIGLSVAVVQLLRRRPILALWIPEALGAGCVAAAAAAWSLWHGYALTAVRARHALLGDRIVAHVMDVNAAASYFAMMACLAAGLAARERGPRRIWWIVVAGSAAEGLSLSGSRAAIGVVVLAAAAAATWLIVSRSSKAVRNGVFAAVLVALISASAIWAARSELAGTQSGAGFRVQFAQSSARMISSHPWLGLGIGRYYQASSMFLNPQLAFAYGSENAHDYFLQLAAELGLIGFAAVAVMLIGAAAPPLRTMARAPDNYRLLGLIAGVAVFLMTCTTGHPFLTPEVAFPFWLATGLMVVLGSPDRPLAGPSGLMARRLVPAVCVVLLAGSIPLRAREAPPGPRRVLPVEGLFDWEDGADGRRYRWSREYASVFVGREARRVEIPVRAPLGDGVAADISVDGGRARNRPLGREWTTITVDLPFVPLIVQARRINIRTSHVEPLPDGRVVGLQFGPPKMLEP